MPRGPLAHAVFRHRARVVIPDTQVQQVEGHRQDRWWAGTIRPEATMEAWSCGTCATRGERYGESRRIAWARVSMLAGLRRMPSPDTASATGEAQQLAPWWTTTDTAGVSREGRAIVLSGGGMTERGIRVTGWNPERRVVRKMLTHHLFFLHDPLPEHQEIQGETDHEHEPGSHDEGQPD